MGLTKVMWTGYMFLSYLAENTWDSEVRKALDQYSVDQKKIA